MLRKDAQKKMNEIEEMKNDENIKKTNKKNKNEEKINEETPFEEEKRIKAEFQVAATVLNNESTNEDQFFQKKTKTREQIEDENKKFTRFLEEEKMRNPQEQIDVLKRF